MQAYGFDSTGFALPSYSDEALFECAKFLASDAAARGVPLSHVFASIESQNPDLTLTVELIKAVSIAWSDEVTTWTMQASCIDPLTDLASVSHLRERMESLYRRAAHEGVYAKDAHEVLLIETLNSFENQLDVALSAIDIVQALHTIFVRDEVIAGLSGTRFAVLVESQHIDADSLAVLAVLLRRITGIPMPKFHRKHLPAHASHLTDFLVDLSS